MMHKDRLSEWLMYKMVIKVCFYLRAASLDNLVAAADLFWADVLIHVGCLVSSLAVSGILYIANQIKSNSRA